MGKGWRTSRVTAIAAGMLVGLWAGQAAAQGNQAYQDFFTQACLRATGQLGGLCAVSRGGSLSTDSEPSLNPNQAAVTASTALARARALGDITERRLEALQDGGPAAPAAGGGWAVFGSVQGEWSEQDRPAYANERAFDADAWRLTAGADYRVSPQVTLGGSITYADYDSEFAADLPGRNFTPIADGGGTDSKGVTFTAFGVFSPAARVYVDASASLGFTDYTLRRNGTFQESNRVVPQTDIRAVGKPDGREFSAALGVGYDGDMGALSLGPYARLRYIRSKIDAYTEADAANTGLALSVSRARTTSVVSTLGLRGSYAASMSWGVLVPQARVEFDHEFEDDPRISSSRLVLDPGATTLRIANDPPDRNSFNVAAGVLMVLPNGVMPYVEYEALLGYSNFDRHRVTAGLRLEF